MKEERCQRCGLKKDQHTQKDSNHEFIPAVKWRPSDEDPKPEVEEDRWLANEYNKGV